MGEFIFIGTEQETREFAKLMVELNIPICFRLEFFLKYEFEFENNYIHSNGLYRNDQQSWCIGVCVDIDKSSNNIFYINNKKDYNYVLMEILRVSKNKNYLQFRRDMKIEELGI